MVEKHIYKGPEIRLDQYLVGLYSMSRAYLQQMIREGHVLINGKKTQKGTILHMGDEIEITPFIAPHERTIEANPSVHFSILAEYHDYIVIDKPPFLPTHPNQFQDRGTLANGLVAKFPQIINIGDDPLRPGIVHRLDSNTSGIMLAALTSEGFSKLRNLFNLREVHKTYVALVLGDVKNAGSVETDIAHHERNIKKMVAITGPNIGFRSRKREAKTMYEPIEQFGEYTLVRVRTLTGRMHQVRVHLASIGHPLVGDTLYQTDREKNRDKLGLTRHFLHAVSIEFEDPWKKTKQKFESSLSADLNLILSELKK